MLKGSRERSQLLTRTPTHWDTYLNTSKTMLCKTFSQLHSTEFLSHKWLHRIHPLKYKKIQVVLLVQVKLKIAKEEVGVHLMEDLTPKAVQVTKFRTHQLPMSTTPTMPTTLTKPTERSQTLLYHRTTCKLLLTAKRKSKRIGTTSSKH